MEEQNIERQEEEVNIEIVDEPQEEQVAKNNVDTDDELDKYTKNVSRRINKKNQQIREAEERAQQAMEQLQRVQTENSALKQHATTLQSQNLIAEEQSIEAKEQQANDIYKRAVEAGDAELMSKADSLKSDLAIQKEKLRVAKNRQQQQPAQTQQAYEQQPQQVQQRAPEPSREALEWQGKNPWYGDGTKENHNVEASQFAYYTHVNLINEGFDADSNDYYDELNKRVYKVYPDLDNDSNAEERDDRPTVQRVTSASVGSRKKTQGNRNGVEFTPSEIKRLRGLKPYNMSEEDWLKRVAKEKVKATTRRETI